MVGHQAAEWYRCTSRSSGSAPRRATSLSSAYYFRIAKIDGSLTVTSELAIAAPSWTPL